MKKDQVVVGQKIYVTKYFLYEGIIEATVVENSLPWDSLMWKGKGFTKDAEPMDWYLTYEEAARRGLELIDLKRKQIAKELDNLLVIESQLKSELNLNKL